MWCGEQAQHLAARQNHTDSAVMSMQTISMEIKQQVELCQEYDQARAEIHDETLSKIDKTLARIAPVKMAKKIDKAMSDCMGKLVDKLTDRLVNRFEDADGEDRKRIEIRRGKQVETTPEQEKSEIQFELGATFSEKENAKVETVIRAENEVDRQELDQNKAAPVMPPGGVSGESPRLEVGQVTILRKKPVVRAVQ